MDKYQYAMVGGRDPTFILLMKAYIFVQIIQKTHS
jgi:hypothetical protein